MSITTGGYVGVQLFDGYTPTDTMKLVNHSDSVLLFTGVVCLTRWILNRCLILKVQSMFKRVSFASRNGFADVYMKRDTLLGKTYLRVTVEDFSI